MAIVPFFFDWYFVIFPFLIGLFALVLTLIVRKEGIDDEPIDIEAIKKRVTKR